MKRIFRHLLVPPWWLRRPFDRQTLLSIERAIADSEHSHLGELRLVIEAVLPWQDALRGTSARTRAIETFAAERVWDTEHNSGVLIYLLLADRDIEIVADRGINARVGEEQWAAICAGMERHFSNGAFEAGIVQGIRAIDALLSAHFPSTGHDNPDELANAPLLR